MSREQEDQERPCLHCHDCRADRRFICDYSATAGSDNVDEADEVIDAIAKTVAELTSQPDGVIRQQVVEHLIRQIMQYDAEFRREDAAEGAIASQARH